MTLASSRTLDFLRGDDAPVLILEHQHAGVTGAWEELIKVGLSDRLFGIKRLADFVAVGQRGGDLLNPPVQGRLRDLDVEEFHEQPRGSSVADTRDSDEQDGSTHQHERNATPGIEAARGRGEMNTLALAIDVVAIAGEQAIADGPGQSAQFLDHDLVLGAPVKFGFGGEAEALVEVLISGINGNHQCSVFISATEGAVRIGRNDFGTDGHRHMNDHRFPPFLQR